MDSSLGNSDKLGSLSIDNIDDYSLMNIFDYLSLRDKIIVQRVCKRWRHFALKSARQVKKLSLYYDFKPLLLKTADLEKILKLCGENLKKISFYRADFKSKNVFPLLNKYCKSLKVLDISEMAFGGSGSRQELNLLSTEIVSNLKEVELHYLFVKSSETRVEFFKRAEKLETLILFENNFYQPGDLIHLSKTITTLDLCCCLGMKDMALLRHVFDRLPNLINLDISATYISSYALGNVCHQLKTFKMTDVEELTKDRDYRNLTLFPELECLGAGYENWFDDDFFYFLIERFPKLKDLNLSYVAIDEVAAGVDIFKLLISIENLDTLNISRTVITDEIIDYWLSNNINLKSICCEYCKNVTELGVLRLVQSLPNLKYVSVSSGSFKNISLFLEEVWKAIKLRRNKTPLTVTFVDKSISGDIEEFKSKIKSSPDYDSLENCKIDIRTKEGVDGWYYYENTKPYQVVKFVPFLKLIPNQSLF